MEVNRNIKSPERDVSGFWGGSENFAGAFVRTISHEEMDSFLIAAVRTQMHVVHVNLHLVSGCGFVIRGIRGSSQDQPKRCGVGNHANGLTTA
jgi:hypothetical protein